MKKQVLFFVMMLMPLLTSAEVVDNYAIKENYNVDDFCSNEFKTGDDQPVGNDLNALVEATTPVDGATIVNLNAGEEYTMSAPITKANLTIAAPDGGTAKIKMEAGAAFAPNTDITLKNLDIDASAASDAVITLSESPIAGSINAEDGYYIINNVNIINCTINNAQQIINNNNVKYCVANMLIDNSIISLNASSMKAAILFVQGFVNNLSIKNSTVYSKGADQDYFVRYNNSGRCDRAGFESNSVNYENCTFYNVAKEGIWGNYSGFAGRNTSYWKMTNNIFVDCGNAQIARRYLGGRANQATATFANNTYWFNGAPEDTGEYDGTGTALTTDPAFKDAANGDFTPTGEAQVAAKTGDPRWYNVIVPLTQCVIPTITILANGKVKVECATEGATCVTNITASNAEPLTDGVINLHTPFVVYTVTAYATKEGYDDSEVATATFRYEKTEGDMNGDGMLNITDVIHLVNMILSK